jgi:hypothetical protein
MESNKLFTAVERFSNQTYKLFEQYSEGKFDRIQLNKLMVDATNKAKEMEKEQIENAYSTGADDEYEHHINDSVKREDIDCEKYYNETYGK